MSNRIDPALILAQRLLGWPDIHPEDYCHKCGVAFECWIADAETWQRGVAAWQAETGREGICCVTCFTEMYAATGSKPIWRLGVWK